MGRKSCFFIIILFTAVILVYVLYPTEKKRIKKIIESCREAVKNENINLLMEHISFNYSDDYGGSYLQLKKRMELAFNRFDDIDITADIMNIAIEDKQADAEIKMSVIASEGNNRGYLIGDAGSDQDIKLYLEKSPFEWKVIKVEGNYNPSPEGKGHRGG
jgi:hypothetical protein